MHLSFNNFISDKIEIISFPFNNNSSCILRSEYNNVNKSSLLSILNKVLLINSVILFLAFEPIKG